MITKPLGNLERVDLRDHWLDEARNFTSWLASEDGLTLLTDTIGMELELVGQEKQVGPFKADILARYAGEEEDHYVVIENQLERTNHDHLGKIITYAAGLQATTIVWIAETFTDEHRQALDWLNDNSGGNLAFFGLQIELWRIGDSVPAPQFKVVSSPNEWARAVKVEKTRGVTDTKLDQLHFWEELRDYSRAQRSALQYRTPRPLPWYSLAVGRSGFRISLTLNTLHQRVGCEILISGPQAKQAFDLLAQQKSDIETELANHLDWQRLDDKKRCRIALYKTGLTIGDPGQRQEANVWLFQMAERFHDVFSDRIKALALSREDGEEIEEEL